MRNLKRAFHRHQSPLIPVEVGTPRESKTVYVQKAPKRSEPYSLHEVMQIQQELKMYEETESGDLIEYVSD